MSNSAHKAFTEQFIGACQKGRIDIVNEYLRDVKQYKNALRNTYEGFRIACKFGRYEVAKAIWPFCHFHNDMYSCLLIADDAKYCDIVNLIIQNKTAVNAAFNDACRRENNMAQIKRMISYGASHFGDGIRHACCNDEIEVVRLLLQCGATLSHETWYVSCRYNAIQVARMHFERGFRITNELITTAITYHNVELSIFLLQNRDDADQEYDLTNLVNDVNETKKDDERSHIAIIEEKMLCALLDANCNIRHPNIKRLKKWRSKRNRRILSVVDDNMKALELMFKIGNLKIIESYLSHEPKHF